jgi:hypothetical protein
MDAILRDFRSNRDRGRSARSGRGGDGQDWLGFGGLKPPSFPIISAAQQFAKKLHAYTLPRQDRMNTRTKDLVDMVLLIREQKLDRQKTAEAIRATFVRRRTHELQDVLPAPPHAWEPVFDALAKECHLDLKLQQAFELVREFAETLGL